MRILIAVHSGHGHVQPMIPLAIALHAAGHETRFVCEKRMADFVSSAGLPAVGLYENTRHPLPVEDLARVSKLGLDRLLTYARAWRPDIVVREWAEMAGLVVAMEVGVPCVTCAQKIRPVPRNGGSHPCQGLMESGITQLLSTGAEDTLDLAKIAARFAKLTEDQDGRVSAALDVTSLFGDLFLSFYPPSVAIPGGPVLANEHHYRPPIHDEIAGFHRPEWLDHLGDKPLVFATLGTTINHVDGVFEAILAAADGLDAQMVIAVGPDRDPGELGPLPANVRATSYLPSSAIMPRSRLAVTHGGFSTMMTALTYGVPVLSIPVYGDQTVNAERCVDLGVGLSYGEALLSGTETTLPDIDHGRLSSLMRQALEPPFTANAHRIASDIAALPPIEAAVPLIEELARTPARADR